jgi:Fur family transcriptional regulator, ferric uptake regulator
MDRFALQKRQFYQYLSEHRLKRTQQRELILETFLSGEHHLNMEELIRRVRDLDSTIGYATVYRTVNIFLESGIAQEIRLRDSVRRIEPLYEDEHHDHLICLTCGQTTEFFNCDLETIQEEVAKLHGFKPLRHSLKIYGECSACRRTDR